MSTQHHLDDGLRRLVDDLSAPATEETRQAIGRRTAVLRRRRRARHAAGAGLLIVALLAGALSLRGGGGPAEFETGPATPHTTDELPAITVDVEGAEVDFAQEVSDAGPDGALGDVPARWEGSFQVFRRLAASADAPELVGPSVFVEHSSSSDAVVRQAGEETVNVGEATGFMMRQGSSVSLRWNPYGSDSTAQLHTWDLSDEEVMQFANGLRSLDEDISFPADDADQFGFEATELPQGIQEDPVEQVASQLRDIRRLSLTMPGASISVYVSSDGERGFEVQLDSWLQQGSEVEQVQVMEDRWGVLTHTGNEWVLTWPPTEGSTATVRIHFDQPADRAAVDEVVAGIREISEDDWQALLEAHGDATG
jgi:hypothetical protein